MKDDLIADLWTLVVEHIPEKKRQDVAADFINTLLDYGVKESVLTSLMGVDPYLDQAVEYSTDGEEYSEEEAEEDEYYEDED
jgi:hypothetical protein